MLMLWHACRSAKEQLFAHPELSSVPVTVLDTRCRSWARISSRPVKFLACWGTFPQIVGKTADAGRELDAVTRLF